MLRWRFSSGIILGLAVGLPIGAWLALLASPNRNATAPNAVTMQQLEDLGHRLEAAQETAARPLRDKMEDISRRIERDSEARLGLSEQIGKAEELIRATQARLDGLEQKVIRPQPAPDWNRYAPPPPP